MSMTAHKASQTAAALDRVRKELARIANDLPRGYGDTRTKDFGIAIGCLSAQAKMWAEVMWDVNAQLSRKERDAA